MWVLNYCAPFIFRATDNINTYRFIMFSEVFALFILYTIFVLLYKIAGITRTERQLFRNQPKETLREMIALKFTSQDYWMSQKDFKEWYLNYFAMHAVAVGIALLYAPYIPQIVFCIIHLIAFIAATILVHFKKIGGVKVAFQIAITLSCLLNVILLFSGAMGVGASGYDENQKLCLLQSSVQASLN